MTVGRLVGGGHGASDEGTTTNHHSLWIAEAFCITGAARRQGSRAVAGVCGREQPKTGESWVR